jgi:hypothetical protein
MEKIAEGKALDEQIANDKKYQHRLELAKASRARSFKKRIEKMKDSTDYRIMDALAEIRPGNQSGSHRNCFRGAPGAETDEHLDMKYNVWKTLRKWKHEVMVEAIFNNGKRADIIDLSTCIIFEITYSETEEMLAEKTLAYPEIFEIRRIDAKLPFNEKLLQ